MFEGWAADVLASTIGKFVDVQRDRLRISLWGGEVVLDNAQLRVDAFDYLQLPFVINEGSIGRLKLQIPWGRWRGGALVVELSDVLLSISSRAETDWEEGPALRRAQAAKQAQLAAAELAKLGSRVAATGSGNTAGQQQQAEYAAAAAAAGVAAAASGGGAGAVAAGGAGWGWTIMEYIVSFLLNRLHVEVKNVHVSFQAPADSVSEYDAFGVQLASLTTVKPGKRPEQFAAFAGLYKPAEALAARVIRQLHVQGWSFYWKPRRGSLQSPPQNKQQQGERLAACAMGTGTHRLADAAAATNTVGTAAVSCAPILDPTDYLLAPVEAVMEIAVHSGSSTGSASAVPGSSSSSSGGLSCEVFIGAPEVAMQLSSQQLVGMARFADDAAVWAKRNKYGRYRPPGWITVLQALQRSRARCSFWGGSNGGSAVEQELRCSQQAVAGSSRSSKGGSCQSSSRSGVVPTGRCGVGAPVTWLQVWQYAVRATLADLRAARRQQGGGALHKRDLIARRRYVQLYQMKLGSLQVSAAHTTSSMAETTDVTPAVPAPALGTPAEATPVGSSSTVGLDAESSCSNSCADESAAATPEVATGCSNVGSESSSSRGSAAAIMAELSQLEQELEVDDILLCRSLSELAQERRIASSTEAERYRSWFAWGTSGMSSFLYPASAQQHHVPGSSRAAAAPGSGSSSAAPSMPTEADFNELLALLHGKAVAREANVPVGVAVAAAAATTAAAAAGGATSIEAAVTGAAAASSSNTGPFRLAPAVSLNWQLLQMHAVLQDCPKHDVRKELLAIHLDHTSVQGSATAGRLSAHLELQDARVFDCCSDPGVRECILQRLQPGSPVANTAGFGTHSNQHWDSVPRKWFHRQGQAAVHKQPLLSISVDVEGSRKHVNLQLGQLQMLARPGCVLGVVGMLQQLPTDTLQQLLQSASAQINAARAFSSTSEQLLLQQHQKQMQVLGELLQVQLSFQLHDLLVVVPTELQYTNSLNAVVQLQGLKLSPSLQLDQGTAACMVPSHTGVIHGTSPNGSTASSRESPSNDFEQLEADPVTDHEVEDDSSSYQSSSNCSSSSSGLSSGADASEDATSAAAEHEGMLFNVPVLHQQQQYTVHMAMLSVSVQQPVADISASSQDDIKPQVQELLRIPAVHGTVAITEPASQVEAKADKSNLPGGVLSSAHNGSCSGCNLLPTWQQAAVVKVSIQLPPISCTVSASVLALLQQLGDALAYQKQLSLIELVACYKVPYNKQRAATTGVHHQQQQPRTPQRSGFPRESITAHTAEEVVCQSDPPSPTDSEVARWMAAPASVPAVAAAASSDEFHHSVERVQQEVNQTWRATSAPIMSAASEQSARREAAAELGSSDQQQLQRCDSDQLLQSMSPSSPGFEQFSTTFQQEQVPRQQLAQAHLPAAAAAEVLALPDLQLFRLELMLEKLDIQYIHDVPTHHHQAQEEQLQPESKGNGSHRMHLRLHASLAHLQFQRSTHGSRAGLTVTDLVLQDMLPPPATAAQSSFPAAAAPTVPDLKRLLNSILVDRVQLSWQSRLKLAGTNQDVHVALSGLQAQGHPGNIGLFILPAHSQSPAFIKVSSTTSKPHISATGSLARDDAANQASTLIAVQVHNLAVGLDGILEVLAAVEAATARPEAGTGTAQARQQHHVEQPQQQAADTATASCSKLAVQVELRELQLLSCRAAAAQGSRPWDVPFDQLHRLGSGSDRRQTQPAVTGASSVVCDLMLDLPHVSVNLPAGVAVARQRGSATAAKPPPVVVLQGLGLFLPEMSQSGSLLPVISIPYVKFSEWHQLNTSSQLPQPEQVGKLAYRDVFVPAVGVSVRPSQLQHLIQLINRQESQWHQWTSGVPAKPKHNKPDKPQDWSQQQLTVALHDLQLLLLPSHGTSDKGVLLRMQQLQLRHVQLAKQQPGQQTTARSFSPAAAHAPPASTSRSCEGAEPAATAVQAGFRGAVSHDAQVSWSQLTISAVQQDSTAEQGSWQLGPGSSDKAQPRSVQRAAMDDFMSEAAVANIDEHISTPSYGPVEQLFNLQHHHEQQCTGGLRLQAASLPAVEQLSRLTSSGGLTSHHISQQTSSVHMSTFASAAAAAPTASVGDVSSITRQVSNVGKRMSALGSTATAGAQVEISSHASLARFSSVQGSVQDGGSYVSDAFFSPRSSRVLLSSTGSTSFLTAVGGSSTGGNSRSHLPHLHSNTSTETGGCQAAMSRTAGEFSGGASGALPAAASTGLDPQSSIIAASWRLDPPGLSPPQGSGLWNSYSAGFGELATSCFADISSSEIRPLQPQQQRMASVSGAVGFHTSSSLNQQAARGVNSSPGRAYTSLHGSPVDVGTDGSHVQRRFSGSPGLLSTSLRSVRTSGHAPVQSVPGNGTTGAVGRSILGQVAGHSFGSQWQDDDAEFYSIAGESSIADDAEFAGDDGYLYADGASPSRLLCSKDDEAVFHELLPLPGFDKHGCLAAARWLLLSLRAGNEASGGIGSTAAVQVTTAYPCEGSRTRVQLIGWQLQVSGKHWDLVAACVMQASNAITAAASQKPTYTQQQPLSMQQTNAGASAVAGAAVDTAAANCYEQRQTELQLLIDVQQLQVMLFLPPDSTAPLHATEQQQRAQKSRQQNKGCSPWQDPGDSPTASAAAHNTADSSLAAFINRATPAAASPFSMAEQQWLQSSAQTLTLRLSASVELGKRDRSTNQPAGNRQNEAQMTLQAVSVPELSVSLGAAVWNAALAQPAPDSSDHAQLLLLLKDLTLQNADAFVAGKLSCNSTGKEGSRLTLSQTRVQSNAFCCTKEAFEATVGSVSGWVSTTRLALLLNLQHQLLAQMPAITAAANLAGGSTAYNQDTAGAATSVAGSASASAHNAVLQVDTTELVGLADSSNMQFSQRVNAGRSRSSSLLTYSLTVQKIAVLCSTDEPEPWLHSRGSGMIEAWGANETAAAFTTCTTPLVEVALLPLQVDLQLLMMAAPSASRSSGSMTQGSRHKLDVTLQGTLLADVYSVDKLGWEPLLDPWDWKVSLGLVPASVGSSVSLQQVLNASIISGTVLDITVAPSCIIAVKQLEALAAAAAAWQADPAMLHQLLMCLMKPGGTGDVAAGGKSCWLLNQTGSPLNYVVADAATASVTAAGSTGSSSTSPGRLPLSDAAASARGRAAHGVPVALPVFNTAAAGYHGRHVEQVSATDASSEFAYKAQHHSAAGGSAAKRSQLIYLQAASQQNVIGPIALEQLGCRVVSVRAPGGPTGAAGRTAGGAANALTRRSKLQQSMVVEVSRHRYGGRLVSLHSCVQFVNSTALSLQLGSLSPLGLGRDPVALDIVLPGESVWLPLQVLQSAAASLCMRPAGLPCTYTWCRALDVLELLPATSSSSTGNSSTKASVDTSNPTGLAASGASDQAGFWYCPAPARLSKKRSSRFISFMPVPEQQQGQQQKLRSRSLGATGGSVSNAAVLDSSSSSGTDPSTGHVQGAGEVVLCIGMQVGLWPDSLASSGAHATAAAGNTGTNGPWRLVAEPPAVFTNCLPVPVQLAVVAGEAEERGLHAVVGSRQSLPIYGRQEDDFFKVKITPHGFQSSPWLSLSGTTGNTSSSKVVAASSTTHDQGTTVAGVEPAQQCQNLQQVTVHNLHSDQPPQVLRLCSSQSSLTGSLTASVSCSLWLFNCLDFQVALQQPCGTEHGSGSGGIATNSSRWPLGPRHKPVMAANTASSTATASNSSASNVLWLRPSPWQPGTAECAGQTAQAVTDTSVLSRGGSGILPGSFRGAGGLLARSSSTPALNTVGLGALASPRGHNGSQAFTENPAVAPSCSRAAEGYPPVEPRQRHLRHRRSISLSALIAQHDQQDMSAEAAAAAAALDMAHTQYYGRQTSLDKQRQLSPRPLSAQEAVRDTSKPTSGGKEHQSSLALQPGQPAALRGSARMRRHSSGLHMLLSGKLPSSLLPDQPTQDSDMFNTGLTQFDLLSPTQHQRLQQLQAQEVCEPSGAALNPARRLQGIPLESGGTAAQRSVVLPLLQPDGSGWMPLLAAGDLSQQAGVVQASPVGAGTTAVPEAPSAQRSAAAAAAAEHLLQELLSQQESQSQSVRIATAAAQQLPGSVVNMSSAGSQSVPGLGALSGDSSAGHQSLGMGSVMPAGSAAQADSSGRSATGIASPAGSAKHLTSHHSGGLVSDASAAAMSATAWGPAAATLCGWSCQGLDNGSTNTSIELQLCAAPAVLAATLAGRGLDHATRKWSHPAKIELRQGGSGPAGVVKLPLLFSSAQSARAVGSLQLATASQGSAAAADSTGVSLRTSLSVGALSAMSDSKTHSPAGVPSQQASAHWGRWSANSNPHQQQGVCFVSVHTAPVPSGGGAWAVHLLPTYLLVNTLQHEVQLRQHGSELVLQTLPPGGQCGVLWPDATLPLKLQFRLAEPGWSWSGAAAVEAPGEFLVKVRHRNRGETLLLQLDVAAASNGSSMVATLSGRQGGFAPYRIENCSCEIIHVQQSGCVEQEDVLQPYSALPYAWDEPSLPHKVLLFLPGYRSLGEFALERVGQARRIVIPSSGRDHFTRGKRRTLLITTYAEGPMRVLRVLDTNKHLLPLQGQYIGSITARAGISNIGGSTGIDSWGSQSSLVAMSRASSGALNQQQGISRSSSTASLIGKAAQSSGANYSAQPASTGTTEVQQTAGFAKLGLHDKNPLLKKLALLLAPSNQDAASWGASGCDTAVVSIPSPLVDIRLQLQGIGISLVSDTRELLYGSIGGLNVRFCQDSVRSAVGLSIGSIRAENTLYGSQYPLLLAIPVSKSVFGVVVHTPTGLPASGHAAGAAGAATSLNSTAMGGRQMATDAVSTPPVQDSTACVAEQRQHQHDAVLDGSEAAAAAAMQLMPAAAADAVAAALQAAADATDASLVVADGAVTQQQTHLAQQRQQQPMLLPNQLAFGVLATVWRTQPSGVVCVEQLGIHASPSALSLDGKHLKQLVDFATNMQVASAEIASDSYPISSTHMMAAGNASTAARAQSKPAAAGSSASPLQPVLLPNSAKAAVRHKIKLYFEDWRVSPITMCISFAPGSWFHPLPQVPGSGFGATSDNLHGTAGTPALLPSMMTAGQMDVSAASSSKTATVPADAGHGSSVSEQESSGTTDVCRTDDSTVLADQLSGVLGSSSLAIPDAAVTADGPAVASLPVWVQMALALAHAEEGAWLTLGSFESSHTMINTDSLLQVLGRHYILAAYQELPKVLASLDIFGDPARLLQALGLGFWHLLTLPAHSARWGPYRSLQRLLRGIRVMAYGISNSIAKGSKRSKAALLPLLPAGLPWHEQGQQQTEHQHALRTQRQVGGSSSINAVTDFDRPRSTSPTALVGASDSSRSAVVEGRESHGGQDLLHVLVAGYSLSFQQMLRSFQTGQPVRGVVHAVAQALVLPALLLLEISESTAASFRRLLVEQVAGAAPARIPRHVVSGQLLRPYNKIESLGRALLHHAPGPFMREEYLGCAELQLGLYAVVTVGHLLLLSCESSQTAAGTASPSGGVTAELAEQQGSEHVQYKQPDLLLVLDVRDVMMVAVEGSSVRLLCMAGDLAGQNAASNPSVAAPAVGPADSATSSTGGSYARTSQLEQSEHQQQQQAAPAISTEGAEGGSAGLRGLVAVEQQQQQLTTVGNSVEAEIDSSSQGSSTVDRLDVCTNRKSPMLPMHAAALAAADMAAVAEAAGAAVAATVSGTGVPELQVGQDVDEGLGGASVGGGKWFIGHTVPCESEAAARHLQQLLQRACQRLDSLIASSVWQRQLLL